MFALTMDKVLSTLLFLLISVCAFAQFNDTTHYHTNYTTSGSINKAKTGSSYLLNNALLLEMKQKDGMLTSTNTWIYGRSDGNLTNNDYSSYLNFDYYKSLPHFYEWGLANYNTSYSLKINNQLLTGLGLAYRVLDRKNAKVNISDGILYDKSDLYLNDTIRDIYHTFRNSLRLQFKFTIKDIFTVNSSSFLQNSLNNEGDYIIRSNTSLGIKLRKWLSFTSTLSYNKMNRTQSENLLFTYGLTLDRFF